jgi:hypothetical protein
MENNMEIPQKIKIDIPYDLCIPFLGIYSKVYKSIYKKGTCLPMFVTASSLHNSNTVKSAKVPNNR